jgi:hypothetical protein
MEIVHLPWIIAKWGRCQSKGYLGDLLAVSRCLKEPQILVNVNAEVIYAIKLNAGTAVAVAVAATDSVVVCHDSHIEMSNPLPLPSGEARDACAFHVSVMRDEQNHRLCTEEQPQRFLPEKSTNPKQR